MTIQLSDHFTYGRLLRFTIPTMVMMVFTSIYGVIDGLFVSNFVGKEAFSALNLIYPLIMMLGALGFMFGTGGAALVAKTLGEKNRKRANGLFSFIICATVVAGGLSLVVVLLAVRPVGQLLGADGSLLDQAVLYGGILAFSLPFLMLQESFQSFLAAAGKPKVGLAVIVGAGIANIILDALFIVLFGWGLAGAALATAVSEVIGGVVPLVYFLRKNQSMLRLEKPLVDFRALGKACANGSSELVSNISMSLVAMLYNYQLMQFFGADGVAAYGVIQYLMWIFISLFLGFSVGSSPLIAYQFGAGNKVELSNLFRKCFVSVATMNIFLTVLALLIARPIALLFVGYDSGVTELTTHALSIYSFVFLVAGFNVFGSAFFTALNNGLVSALISFIRTLVFEVAAILILPAFFGEMGIWSSIIVAEGASVLMTMMFLFALRNRYGYMESHTGVLRECKKSS